MTQSPNSSKWAVLALFAIAQFLWFYALHTLTAGAAGLGTLLNPVFGVLFAAAQLGERPGTTELFGMVAIVIALVINSSQMVRKRG